MDGRTNDWTRESPVDIDGQTDRPVYGRKDKCVHVFVKCFKCGSSVCQVLVKCDKCVRFVSSVSRVSPVSSVSSVRQVFVKCVLSVKCLCVSSICVCQMCESVSSFRMCVSNGCHLRQVCACVCQVCARMCKVWAWVQQVCHMTVKGGSSVSSVCHGCVKCVSRE